MNRREFIGALGSAAAWPRAAGAQQGERLRRTGVLMPLAADDPEGQTRIAAFIQGLQELGWTDGRNMRIEYRWVAGDAESVRKHAAELVALTPDVILAYGTTVMGPLQQVTRTMPIVFVQVSDPVGAGFVESLARPGGNATGFTAYEFGFEREMAGTAQGDRPACDAGSGPSRSSLTSGIAQFGAMQAVGRCWAWS